MTKIQKVWLWVSVLMFIIPEISFSFILTFFAFMYGQSSFPSLVVKIFGTNFWETNTILVNLSLGIEYLGILSLFIWNIKFNNRKIYRLIVSIFLGFLIITLSLIFALIYSVANMSFP